MCIVFMLVMDENMSLDCKATFPDGNKSCYVNCAYCNMNTDGQIYLQPALYSGA